MTAFMSATQTGTRKLPLGCKFDTDSYEILIDNGASVYITPCRDDFISYRELNSHEAAGVLGVSGTSAIPLGIGTARFSIKDDQGKIHSFEVDDAIHLPASPLRLWSPQTWAIQRENKYGDLIAHADTNGRRILIEWEDQGQTYKKTVLLGDWNVGIINSAPVFSQFRKYAMAFPGFSTNNNDHFESDDDNNNNHSSCSEHATAHSSVHHHDVHLDEINPTQINNGSASVDNPTNNINNPASADNNNAPAENNNAPIPVPVENNNPTDGTAPRGTPLPADFHNNKSANATAASTLSPDEQVLMGYHERLGHLGFAQLKLLAELGFLPKRLAKCRQPKCPGCMYGKMNRKPWRTTKSKSKKPTKARQPGDVVYCDQLE
jgi:hypothetical protein